MNSKCINIKIIAVWFGKFQDSIRAWSQSVSYNKTIDFLLVTDQEFINPPKNLCIERYSFEEFVFRIKALLGEDIVLDRPYKLCDYKPAYGEIFKQELMGFDYWGYCDTDLIFGDLAFFFKKYELIKYDRFLRLGHLTLYRNAEKNIDLYRLNNSIPTNWQKTCHTKSITVFDERGDGVERIYCDEGLAQFSERIFADITKYKKRFTSVIRTKEDKSSRFEVFLWEKGKLYRIYHKWFHFGIDEKCYVHFQKRIMLDLRTEADDLGGYNNNSSFILCQKGIIDKPDKITLRFVQENNPYRGFILEKIEEFIGIKKYDPQLLFYNKLLKILHNIPHKIKKSIRRRLPWLFGFLKSIKNKIV